MSPTGRSEPSKTWTRQVPAKRNLNKNTHPKHKKTLNLRSGAPINAIILGAAGRDFHIFNVYFKNNPKYRIVAFTAAQIPGIANRRFPKELSGPNYPNGIRIYPEEKLPELISNYNVEEVVLSYSDLSNEEIMHKASSVLANGADFLLLSPETTMLKSKKPVVSICAVRTGAGKSTVARKVSSMLRKKGYEVIIVRHPMPYGNLRRQIVQRFETYEDLDRYECTIEEREEYEPHLDNNFVVYAGVDYEKILKEAEKEADIILWDGGNNDLPFFKPGLHIVVADPLRPGHEMSYYHGEMNVRMANIIIINKVRSADPEAVETVNRNLKELNPKAVIVKAASKILVDKPELIEGKRVLVIEDGPTVTHGQMSFGAGTMAAEKFGAMEIVDPRPFALGSLKGVYKEYPHLKKILPSMGYGKRQIKELEETINRIDCDTVVFGNSTDLRRVMKIDKPTVKVGYALEEINGDSLEKELGNFLKAFKP